LVAHFRQLIKFLQCLCVFRYDTHTARQPGSLFWCHAVVSLLFTRVHSFAWPNLGANFSGVRLYCVTIPWQQILKGSLQVTIEGVLPHVAFEHTCHA